MKPDKYNVLSRRLIIILTKTYLVFKSIIESLVRRVKFSISFKIGLRYLRWFFITLLLSTFLIVGGLTFLLIEKDWVQLNIIKDEIINKVNQAQKFEFEDEKYDLNKNSISLYILDSNNSEVEIIGFGEKNYYDKYYKYKRYSIIQVQNKSVFLSSLQFIKLDKEYYQLIIHKNIDEKLIFVIKFFYIVVVAQVLAMMITFFRGIKTNKHVLKPINEMTRITKKISVNSLNLRINVKGIQDELKELAITINEMMDRLEHSYKLQQEFVSDASHELRTPIAVLQGYANMLSRWGKEDPEVLEEGITAIKNESENMKELVEKLLFLARSEVNDISVNRNELNITILLDEIIKESKIIDTNHEIIGKIEKDLIIHGDIDRVKQAIRIFIDNAIKYSKKESNIFIGGKQIGNNIIITVKDEGIGISGEDIKYIFDRFYRTDKSRNRQSGGLGLGLSIAKIIVLSHKGKIIVRSKEGEGAEFQIVFPKV